MNSLEGNNNNNNNNVNNSIKWMMSMLEPLEDVGVPHSDSEFFWCDQTQPDVSSSAELNSSGKEIVSIESQCTRKRSREDASSVPGSKACREKMRRDKLNDRFMELSSVLEPGRVPKSDKATILSDATRVLTQLRDEAQKLKNVNEQLHESIKELKAEKNELRDEKLRLKAEKEKLEQQIKSMMMPSGFLHPASFQAASAFAAQAQAAGNKTMPIPGFPGMAMWQWMPSTVVDTSQDHVLRPPVA